MVSATARSLATLALGLGLGLLQAEAAAGSAFRVTPIQVVLSNGQPSALLTLKNESQDTLRFQVSVFAWSQGPHGEIELAPTQDIVFFPALVTVDRGQEAKVRLGAVKPSGPVERSYRVFVEELKPLETPGEAAGASRVRVLTKMGVPIFVRPAVDSWAGAVEGVSVAGRSLRLAVRNTGNVHFSLLGVKVAGFGQGGEVVFERQLEGWYVLPGGVRDYDLSLSADECGKLRAVEVTAQTDRGPIKSVRQDVPAGACVPSARVQ